jgi:Zn-dependent M28 family amino/carboxypeptidase
VDKVFSAATRTIPHVQLSCEDYGLVMRLAANRQGPRLRLDARSEDLGEVPVFNVVAELKGSEKPDEYVVLSAHLDSWDGSSGATDNGTGTTTMLEAIRILRQSYPNPKRTIVVGHWGGEEQGLIGSRSFVADHPEIVRGLHALFNQDNGTGRVRNISMQGLVGAGAAFGKWFARLPAEVTESVNVGNPGMPSGGGSDNASFACHGTPAFGLGSLNWDYFSYTWHTNRDTYDKIVPEDLKRNATLTAMLVYLADQEPEQLGRERRVMPVVQRTGQQAVWPECGTPARAFSEWTR